MCSQNSWAAFVLTIAVFFQLRSLLPNIFAQVQSVCRYNYLRHLTALVHPYYYNYRYLDLVDILFSFSSLHTFTLIHPIRILNRKGPLCGQRFQCNPVIHPFLTILLVKSYLITLYVLWTTKTYNSWSFYVHILCRCDFN